MRYAGIGSRRTPPDIIKVMEDFAAWAAPHATLLSGGAPGADQAFEFGARVLGSGQVETYLPWKGFAGIENGTIENPSQAALEIAQKYHPRYSYLKRGAKLLMGRNSYQVLGKDLMSPVDLVVCWTPDGSLDGKGNDTGGTGQALRIAADNDIAILNLALEDHLAEMLESIT